MKIAFITIHIGVNVGSNLQAIATSELLKEAGHEPLLINYIPPRSTYQRYWKVARKNIVKFVWRIINFALFHYLTKKFENYQKKYCEMTRPIYDTDNFAEALPHADIYMTSSDQVWNFRHNEGFDYHYFFKGVDGRKVSYASSIGMDDLSSEEAALMEAELKQFDKISVREDIAVELLKDMGIESVQHIDPTLMLTCDRWKPYMSNKVIKDPYLLVYHPYNIKDINAIYDVARAVAKKKHLRVVTFTWGYGPVRLADKTIYYASSGDFLSLMYHADFIITNSFHGTAFSVNFNKPFFVLAPSHFSSRITSIGRLLHIEDRFITSVPSDEDIEKAIDYESVNKILEKERIRAMEYLKSL